VPGYRPLALDNGASISLSSAWRGRWVDITGLYHVGLRDYDPIGGRWLSYDSVWNERDPNAYTYCGGDPINGFDADGRILLQSWQQTQQNLINSGGFWNNVAAYGISFGSTVFNVASLGNLSRNDALADQNMAGQISDAQMYGGMSLNTGVALTSVAIGGGTASLLTQSGKIAASLAVPTAFVAGGAAVGVGSQAASDILLNQQMSSFQTYENDAVAGGIGGLTTYLTAGNLYAGGAAGGLTKSLLTQGENMSSDPNADFSYWNAGQGTVLGAVPGVFGANGFYSSVEAQILTKMENGTIQNVASTTAQNIFANEVQTGLPSIGVDVTKDALFGEQPAPGSSSSGSAYLQGPLGGKH